MTLKIAANSSVKKLKELVESTSSEHIPANQQCLIYNGILLEGSYKLKEYDMRGDSQIQLFKKRTMQVSVRTTSGKEIKLEEVTPSTTIGQVKALIQEEDGTPKSSQTIAFEGRELEDNRTLGDHGIGPKSVLLLYCTSPTHQMSNAEAITKCEKESIAG